MPEACFLCLDSTEYMRNGDQFPTRLLAELDAANLLVNAKLESNAENTIGFLVTGGGACTVHETLTNDVDQMMAAISAVSIKGNICHFNAGLLIAALALSHRTNPRAEKRIVVFVGSPLQESEKELEQLAKRLRKDDVSVDVITFGVESNVPLLESFVNKINRNGTSRFLSVNRQESLTDALMNSPILIERDDTNNVAAGAGGIGGNAAMIGASSGIGNMQAGGRHGDVGFNVDPNVDPELALAIRLSMEEEEQRQATIAAVAANANATNITHDNNKGNNENNTVMSAPAHEVDQNEEQTTNSEVNAEEDDNESMTEEEMLQKAIQMSLEEAQQEQQTTTTSNSNVATNNNNSGNTNTNGENEETDFEEELRKELKKSDANNNNNNNNDYDDKNEHE